MTQIVFFAFVAAIVACGVRSDSQNAATWRTVFDSTSDTIVARTTGDVPEGSERRLVLEQRIGEAEGSDTVTFGQISFIAITGDDRVFVFDGQGPSLKLFDSSGKFVRFVGRKGAGPGEFEQVNGMDALPNGSLVLWDASHSRVNVYSAAGDYQSQWRVPLSGYFSWKGLYTDREGATVLAVPIGPLSVFGEQGFFRFDSTGNLTDTIRVPRWVDTTPVLTASVGTQVRQAMPVPFAPQLAYMWSWTGALLSGPSDRYDLYSSKSGVKPLRISRVHERVRVLPGERDDQRQWLTAAMRRTLPDWSWSGPDIPAYKPSYAGFATGYDGRIWVSLYSRGEQLDVPEPVWDASPGNPPPPLRHYREPNVYDVFESDGRYLGCVHAERSQQLMRMRGDRAWGVLTDSLGVAYVARWRVEPSFVAPTGPR